MIGPINIFPVIYKKPKSYIFHKLNKPEVRPSLPMYYPPFSLYLFPSIPTSLIPLFSLRLKGNTSKSKRAQGAEIVRCSKERKVFLFVVCVFYIY